MRRLLIIADRPGWAFGRRAEALQRYAPKGWQVVIDYIMDRSVGEIVYEQHDLVFLLAPHRAKDIRHVFSFQDIRVPLVISHNSGVGRRDYSLSDALVSADYTIVNNYGAWQKGRYGAKNYPACNISNGVDTTLFRELVPLDERPLRVLWTGSQNKAEDEYDVKGYRMILKPLERILKARGYAVDFRVVEPDAFMTDEEMVEFYNSGQLLVCSSSSEGTPNICLEAAACGTALVTSPVGNMPELIRHEHNGYLVRDWNTAAFWGAIQQSREHWARFVENMRPTIQEWDWSHRSKWFYALFAAIIERGAENVKPFTYMTTVPEAVHADQLCRC